MSEGKRSRKLVWSLIAVVAVLAVVGGLWMTGNLPPGARLAKADATADSTQVADSDAKNAKIDADEEDEEVAVPVELARASRRQIAAFYRAASVIEADRLVDLVTRVQGRVQAINVEEGDWVQKGDVLAEIENGREKIQLRRADLQSGEKERLLERSREMLAEELISHQDFVDADMAFQLALAERDLASIAVEETFIRAPFAGQVTERKIVLGQQVILGGATFTLADFEPLRVRVHLPESVARKITTGQRVLVAPEAVAEPIEALVERISPVVDPATSTVRLTLLLREGAEQARVGGFAKVRITTDTHTDALAVPKTALVEEGGLRSLFVAAADTVRKVEIKTGLYDETHIEVLDGLSEGEYVVTLGQGGLRTGTRIDALNGEMVGYAPAPESESRLESSEDTVAALTIDH